MTKYKLNLVRQRASPTEITLESGHVVRKEKWLYIKVGSHGYVDVRNEEWETYEASDYHGEHFLYVDPLYLVDGPEGAGHQAFMCTCGSMGVVVGPSAGELEDSNRTKRMVVCFVYHNSLQAYGVGHHADQVGRKKWW